MGQGYFVGGQLGEEAFGVGGGGQLEKDALGRAEEEKEEDCYFWHFIKIS